MSSRARASPGIVWKTSGLVRLVDAYRMAGFDIGNFQYVYYLAVNNDLHQLFYNNSSWADEDLTVLTKTSPASTRLLVSNLRCRSLRARDSVRRKAASFKRASGKSVGGNLDPPRDAR